MYAIRCNIKDIEKIKKKLVELKALHKEFLPKKIKNEFFFPLSEKIESFEEVNDDFFEKKIVLGDLKSLLKSHFTVDELTRIKTAYDIVGSIAILEIDKEFFKKKKYIAQAILKQNKQIKTVLMKSGIHTGTYRTQNMIFLEGENTKEAIHLENKIKLKLNVESVYFSPRLSEERKRISSLVKEKESVIELFSGCAPYAINISKNSLAKEIYGIEINPEGHWYGLENIDLNKTNNVKLFCGDVKVIAPNINKLGIGHKGGLDNFEKIYFDGMQIYELQLKKNDLDEKFDNIIEFVDKLALKGVSIMFHQIMDYHNKDTTISTKDLDVLEELVSKFLFLCKKKNVIGFGLHCANIPDGNEFISDNDKKNIQSRLINNLNFLFKKYQKDKIKDYLYLENTILGVNTIEDFKDIKLKTGLKNVVLDLVHLFISNIYPKNIINSVKKEIDVIKYRKLILEFKKNFKVYFHIGDTTCEYPFEKDACEIGKGIIDFNEIVDLLDFGVIEVWDYFSKDYKENILSRKKLFDLIDKKVNMKTFDRILMPLPKTAENFLDDALKISNDGTIIHFYDFLNELNNEIPNKAVDKIILACKKNNCDCKIINYVKCGDHAPHVYRVCIDFKVIKNN